MLFGLAAGVVLSRRFDILRSRGPWLAAAIAALLLVPHVVWQAAHGFPTLEFMGNARRLKMAPLSPLGFLGEVLLQAGPVASLLVVVGIGSLLIAERNHAYRPVGWSFIVILLVMIASGAKPYYLAPFHVISYAAGAVVVKGWTACRHMRLLRSSVLAALVIVGALAAPLAKPLLGLETLARYSSWLGIKPSPGERHETGQRIKWRLGRCRSSDLTAGERE